MPRDGLEEYRQKRDQGATPEPFGDGATIRPPTPGAAHMYCVQQHAATAMHWDVRLEVDGVLVSFAVPRGPTTDPGEKRLAVMTEAHPIEYATFEGIIPEGNYGAGAMILWDRGQYRVGDGTPPSQGLEEGKLDLVFAGPKLRGRWTLVRIKGENGKNWLFIHKPARGVVAHQDLAATLTQSILSGLTVDELERGVDRTASLADQARAAGGVVRAIGLTEAPPMLAESAPRPFTRDGWIFEVKLDGWRAIVHKRGPGDVVILTRNGRDVTESFPEVARAARHLPAQQFIMDGEVVALDERGFSSFQALQQRLGLSDDASLARAEVEIPAVLQAFDLLSVGGVDIRDVPLTRRKDILQQLVPRIGVIRFGDHVEREGELLFEEVRRHDAEGIIAKRGASTYQGGRRSDDWLKMKPVRTADLVVVGGLPSKSNEHDLGSILVAWWRDGQLDYAGRVGTGWDHDTRNAIHRQLLGMQVDKRPFGETTEKIEKTTFFVRPELVAEVRYTEVTADGILRHPVWVRMRDDKRPEDCTAPLKRATAATTAVEPPAQVRHDKPTVRFTNLDKVYFPRDGYTKKDLLAYYEAVWPHFEPYLRDRPVVLTRYPDGMDGKNFYQKNAPPFTPEWVETLRIEDTDYFVCNRVETLLYVINSGAIPLHVWHSRRGSLDQPDWCVIDLDPKGAPRAHVMRIARELHALLDDVGAANFIKTSGQAGMHILVPVRGLVTHNQSKMLGELIARVVVARLPEIATIERHVGSRAGKVYVDFLQNGYDKLIASIFSARPKDGAPVSMPVPWDEVTDELDPGRFTIKTAVRILEERGDPCRGVLGDPVDLESVLGGLAERAAR